MIQIERPGRLEYDAALQLQFEMVEKRRSGEITDTALLLEHEPVYTIGRTRDQSSLRDPEDLPHPVVEISRGGQATYHGPGQLVGYLILDLKDYGRDLHLYLRALEAILIDTCADFGLDATRRDGLTGVWSADRKLASIGVGVKHWISLHGFAINIGGDLTPFQSITPCGISDVQMTSLSAELGREILLSEFSSNLEPHLNRRLEELRR
ncbi:MAG: lipoyl(octanoyl) transferase [Verrucomicrobiales bacterium]|jgi:lipoyl(octanoyl) transferase